MSESVNTLSLDLSQGESLANKRKAVVMEDHDEPREPKRYKISPRATLDALSGLRISRERVFIPETLDTKARGASASVQLAILLPPEEEHLEHPSAQGHFVALKQFRLDDDKGDKEGLAPLAHELSLLRNLKHKNIVRVLGFVENVAQGIAWMVLPWAPNGNLRDFVQSKSALWGPNISPRFALIMDVTRGLDYLHGQSEPICHGDLKSLNILVDAQQNAVITDFGSARVLGKGREARSETNRRSHSTTKQKGPRVEFSISTGSITMTTPNYTVRWAAPEVLDGDLPTLASDIWSLGWIYWEVLTGKFPFNDILRDQDVIIGVLGGELPKPQTALAHSIEPIFLVMAAINSLCKLMETCLVMDPQRRPKCCDAMASLRDLFSDLSNDSPSEKKFIDSLTFLRSMGEKRLSEGRPGEAIQYIHELNRVAQLTKRELAAIVSQEMLDRCRRSISRVETVHEEEAGISWNVALTFFASQLHQEAKRQVTKAARLYKELGFEAQALECDQFLDAIHDAMGILRRYPQRGASYDRNLPKLLLTRPERFTDPLHSAKDSIYERRKKQVEIVWLVAGALQCASPDSLAVEKIVSLIEGYHPGKIPQCQEAWCWSENGNDTEFIKHILRGSKAFEADETLSGYWRLSELHRLPPFPTGERAFSTREVLPGRRDRFKTQIPWGLSKHTARDEEVGDSHVFLRAVSEKHLSEGRLGEAIQYIQELRRVARLTKSELAAIVPKELLDRCKMSTSGLETVHEEEAGTSWNLALTFFADQLHEEAARHVINAARLYKELGLETRALECDQFLDAIQDANGTRILPRRPRGAGRYHKDLPKLLLTHPERFRGLVTSTEDTGYESRKMREEISWLVAGALQCASPDPLPVEKIVSFIEGYHPGKVRQCRKSRIPKEYKNDILWIFEDSGAYEESSGDSRLSLSYQEEDKKYIKDILSAYEAFEEHETSSGYWRLVNLHLLPPFPHKIFLCGYFTPVGSPEERFK